MNHDTLPTQARDRRNHAKENLRKSGVSLCAKAALKEALERSHAAHAGKKTAVLSHLYIEMNIFTKTGSGQT
jgi:hypothetical protein